jgi:hypothetical protein
MQKANLESRLKEANMKVLKTKKAWGTLLVVLFLVSLVFISTIKMNAGDLGCKDLSNCSGKASCGEPGNNYGCEIECESGPRIDCPEVE